MEFNALVEQLLKEYTISKDILINDVNDFIQKMVALKILEEN